MITIKNDTGTLNDTRLIGPDGVDLVNVVGLEGVTIMMRPGDPFVRACASMGLMRVDVAADKVEWLVKNPLQGDLAPVASITFVDGTTVRFSPDGAPEVVPAG